MYLRKQGQHVGSISIGSQSKAPSIALFALSDNLQLSSLTCERGFLVLLPHPTTSSPGVLDGSVVARLKLLRLKDCDMLAELSTLAAAVAQLSDLQHLCIDHVKPFDGDLDLQTL